MKRLLLLALAAFLVECDLSYDVHVELVDASSSNGFGCADDAGLLAAQILKKPEMTVVLDVLDFGTELMPCSEGLLAQYCVSNGCPVQKRACFSVAVDAGSTEPVNQQVLDSLHAQDAGLSGLSPDRNLMVRIVGTSVDASAACAEDGGAYVSLDPSTVFGCALSCPQHLSASGTAELFLDTFGASCKGIVCACATLESLDLAACGLQ